MVYKHSVIYDLYQPLVLHKSLPLVSAANYIRLKALFKPHKLGISLFGNF